jgi:predicted RecB family nuclease
VEAGVYLWGTLVSGPPDTLQLLGIEPGYRPFFSWEPVTPAVQSAVFHRFWTWLTDLRHRAEAAGITVAAYCYTAAEHKKMLQILAEAPTGAPVVDRAEVDALVTSASWVDLYEVVRGSLVLGHGLGLKRIAPLAGFSWRDPDAGGLQSMSWHRDAVDHPDPAVRAHNRQRLLWYNEDDVRATLAVRRWLRTATIPSIADWEPAVTAATR